MLRTEHPSPPASARFPALDQSHGAASLLTWGFLRRGAATSQPEFLEDTQALVTHQQKHTKLGPGSGGDSDGGEAQEAGGSQTQAAPLEDS